MADTFTKQIIINYQAGLRSDPWVRQTSPPTQATAKSVKANPTIGTTEELLAVGEITTLGECVFQNLDETNYLEIGKIVTGTFTAFAKIPPLQQASFVPQCTAAQLAAKANTAACVLDYIIFSA